MTSELPRRTAARAGDQQIFCRQRVHPGFVGGKENVRGRAGLDLPRQRAGRGEVENNFVAGRFFIIRGDPLERLGQARGGKNRHLRGVKLRRQRERRGGSEKRFEKFHGRRFFRRTVPPGFAAGQLRMERVKGIEPSSQAWEAHVLPLDHTRFRFASARPARSDSGEFVLSDRATAGNWIAPFKPALRAGRWLRAAGARSISAAPAK